MRVLTIVIALSFGACAGAMANVQGGACEAGCGQAKDTCVSECVPPEGDAGDFDKAACELACEETRKKCVSDCK